MGVKCTWIVHAGLVPNQVDPKLTRRFELLSDEWEKMAPLPVTSPFADRMFAVMAYAAELQQLCASGRSCNWVRIDFVWY